MSFKGMIWGIVTAVYGGDKSTFCTLKSGIEWEVEKPIETNRADNWFREVVKKSFRKT